LAILLPAPSYGLHQLEGWIALPDMRYPIPSLSSERWHLSVAAKPPSLDIRCGFDRLGTFETESYMEKLAFTCVCLSGMSVIMAIMHVPLVELLC
jgi:hypothetical protein